MTTHTHVYMTTHTHVYMTTHTQTEGRGDEPMQHEYNPTCNMNTSGRTCKT